MNKLFTYPNYGTPDGYPDYTAHSGQIVTIVRELVKTVEYDFDPDSNDLMFEVKADDGWTGSVWASELSDV